MTQECCEQYWTSPGVNTQQNSSRIRKKKIKVRRTRHAGHCWKSRDELISDLLQWTSSHGRAKAGRPARTYIQLLCALKTYRERWTIETVSGRRSERPLLTVRHDVYEITEVISSLLHTFANSVSLNHNQLFPIWRSRSSSCKHWIDEAYYYTVYDNIFFYENRRKILFILSAYSKVTSSKYPQNYLKNRTIFIFVFVLIRRFDSYILQSSSGGICTSVKKSDSCSGLAF